MSELLTASLGNRVSPDHQSLDTAHRRAVAAQIALGAYLATLVLSFAWYTLNPFYTGVVPEAAASVVFLIAAVLFARWKMAAYRMVPDLSGAPADRSPGWAAGGYFVPIMNLWVPFQIMGEIRDSAEARSFADALGFESDRRLPLGLWWTLWIGTGIASRIFDRFPEPIGESTGYLVFALAVNAASVALTVVAIVVVRQMDEGQQQAALVLSRLRTEKEVEAVASV